MWPLGHCCSLSRRSFLASMAVEDLIPVWKIGQSLLQCQGSSSVFRSCGLRGSEEQAQAPKTERQMLCPVPGSLALEAPRLASICLRVTPVALVPQAVS